MQFSSAFAAAAALALLPEVTIAAGPKCKVDLMDAQKNVVSTFEALAGLRRVVRATGFSWTCKTDRDTCKAIECIVPKRLNLTPVGEQIDSGKPKTATEGFAAKPAVIPNRAA
ncbi:hypothetical protein PspLS_10284 [Pyricularia sp. CBS 133598]|nr:hypothetical protein PspLS_10284 [Pyricularia sp. CBS 133598]